MIQTTLERSTAADGASNALHQDHPAWGSRRQLTQLRTARHAHPVRGTGNILVIADEPLMRAVFASVLRKRGYEVFKASGTLEAQRLASKKEIDLVVMDSSSPDGNELHLALWFRAVHPETKVLVACASLWDLNYRLGDSQEVVFLAKPFTALQLTRIVRRVLD